MESVAQNLTGHQLTRIEPIARHFAITNGLCYYDDNRNIQHAPITLLPSPFPLRVMKTLSRLQKHVNFLYHRVACDHTFLTDVLQESVQCDDYIANLWKIYDTVHREGLSQNIFLGLNRADYMLDVDDTTEWTRAVPKQVEVNLMASSFGGLCQNLVRHHRQLLRMIGMSEEEVKAKVPDNPAADGLAKGLISAWHLFKNRNAIILFVVNGKERNVFDQRLIEEAIYRQEPEIVVRRYSFEQLAEDGFTVLGSSDRKLTVNKEEVAVVYYRDGYVPIHFQSPSSWNIKLTIERSTAIKCPCIQYMLVNTKKVQMALCDPVVLQKYVPDRGVLDQLLSTFAQQTDPRQEDVYQQAVNSPDKFVLKPQREGGGNNFFGSTLRDKLLSMKNSKDLAAYVLMARLRPPSFYNFALTSTRPVEMYNMVSEIGIFGVFLGAGDTTYANYQCGHLLRTKPSTTDEGGVSAGFSCLDSPYLI